MNVISICLVSTLTLLLQSCAAERQAESGTRSVTQGVTGTVVFWKGDFMPGLDRSGRAGTGGRKMPVAREVYIHALTDMGMVEQAPDYSPFYSRIRSELVVHTRSDSTGFFRVALPPGRYSCFVKEDSMFYANEFDGDGNILAFEVARDSVTHITIDITYEATF